MNEDHRLLLLKILKSDGNIQPLADLGYEFAKITQAIKLEESLGNFRYKNGKFTFTKKGLREIALLTKHFKQKFPWIEPEHTSKIHPLKKDEIYIPDKESIRYLFK
ncbi:MAG TPA: hypothetical protein VK658_04070 [Chryseolinea sp.]|nr:hypothetical protein [Chryseolinea sp.]